MDTEFDPTAYADVVPVPDDDSPDQPAPIAYSPQCSCGAACGATWATASDDWLSPLT